MANIKPRILFYDIETTPLKAWVWRTGKQYVGYNQFCEGHDRYDIINICYEWNDSNKKHVLTWDKNHNSKKMIKDFTKICKQADIIIGKNNKRFDDKFMNTMRLIHDLPGAPELLTKVDDLESQIRRHFYLPSFSLDYISKLLNLNGKNPMCFQDWIDIMEGESKVADKALKKMVKYCSKDVSDTKKIWNYCEKHFKPKIKIDSKGNFKCQHCGSTNIHKNGVRATNGILYQRFYCNDHGGNAGKLPINKIDK